jgi:hypothetical protein
MLAGCRDVTAAPAVVADVTVHLEGRAPAVGQGLRHLERLRARHHLPAFRGRAGGFVCVPAAWRVSKPTAGPAAPGDGRDDVLLPVAGRDDGGGMM